MKLKLYLTNFKKSGLRSLMLMVVTLLFAGITSAQVYENGPLSTGATSSNGTAAPAGTTWSEVQNPNINAGFGANITAGLTVADNFTICGSWNITKVTFYAYSTGYSGATSPFNDVRVKIYNTDPSVGSPAAIYGDLTTNRFLASTFTNMYRIFNATPDQNRRIWAIEANVNTTLTSGTYWIEWQLGNGGLSNFSPAVTIVGTPTLPGWNAKQNTLPNSWVNLVDGAAGPQDMPFKIDYTTAACTGTPAPGNTIASAPNACPGGSVLLSLQNCTPGSGVSYQWQSASAVGGPYTNIPGATGSTYNATISATTFYQAVVTCSGNPGTSTPVQVSLNPPSACYCTPPATNCTLDDEILNVKFGTLDNSSSGCSGAGYTNYTASVAAATNVFIGAANPMTVTIGPGGNDNVGVWIDYNTNGVFDASEFTLLGTAATGAINGNINVPSTVTSGTYRMRIRVKFNTPVLTGTQACAAYTYGETEDYLVNIIPCVPVTVTTQPVNRSIACEASTTFTVALAGSLPTGYWEYRTSSTGIWQNVPATAPYSGVNTTTLTVTNAPSTLNGYQYRFVYQGACTGVDFSSAATLTITPLIANVTPASASICLGSTQQLTINNIAAPSSNTTTVSSGPLTLAIPDNSVAGTSHVIPVSLPAGAQITNMSVTLNMTHSWAGDMVFVLKAPNGAVFNLDYYLTGTGGAASVGFTNTVISSTGTSALSSGSGTYTGTFRPDAAGSASAPAAGPTGFTPTVGTFAGLYSTPNGNWTLAMYDGGAGDVGTLTSWSLNFTYLAGAPATGTWTGPAGTMFTDAGATVPYTGAAANSIYVKPTVAGVNNYTVTVVTPNCTSPALTIPVSVRQLPTALAAPANSSICETGNTTFTATPADGFVSSVQWQVSTDGGTTYTNITNGGVYTGATTNTLTITGAGNNLNNNRYRMVATAAPCAGTINSAAGTLTVNPLPVLGLTASLTEIYPGQTSTITATASTTVPANGYTWYKDGVLLTGVTGNTHVVDVDALGTYTVEVSDANGCGNAVPASITISSAANDILFIYPSPNSGQFQVRYFSELGATAYPRLLNMYDSKGSRVFSKSYSITSPYTRLDVDASRLSRGIYSVELIDFNGNRLKTGRVLIQ